MFTLMTEPVVINTTASSANITINRDKNKTQTNSEHLAGVFRKWGETSEKRRAGETQVKLSVLRNSTSFFSFFENPK